MRLVTFRIDGESTPRVGVLAPRSASASDAEARLQFLHVLEGVDRLTDLIGEPQVLSERAEAALADRRLAVALGEVRVLSPVPEPPAVRDFLAFERHLINARAARGVAVDPLWYELPVFYFSNPAATLGPEDDVPMAPGTAAFDYELEVAAIVGVPGSDLDPLEAEAHIAGYCILADWSARDIQAAEMRLGLGPAKGKDTATTLGPWLVTPDELADRRAGRAYDLEMSASVNGRSCSGGNLREIYWSFGELLAYASRGTTLRTGDVIGSGTVGTGCLLELGALHGRDLYPWLAPGDVVELRVERLGQLRQRVVPGRRVVPLRP